MDEAKLALQRHPAGPWQTDFMPGTKVKASFIEPMLLLRSETLPDDPNWIYELKLDGYRALAMKTGGKIELRSRNNNDFSARYPDIPKALTLISLI